MPKGKEKKIKSMRVGIVQGEEGLIQTLEIKAFRWKILEALSVMSNVGSCM